MRIKLKSLIDELIPPGILRGAKAVFGTSGRNRVNPEPSGEKDSDWYDASFNANDAWRSHYLSPNIISCGR